MEYKSKLKKKKYFSRSAKLIALPFPLVEEDEKISAIFNGFSVEIVDSTSFGKIHDNGCYGKGSVSRSAPNILKGNSSKSNRFESEKNIIETLVLDLEEAFLLSHFVKAIEIKNVKGEVIDDYELFKKFCNIKYNFVNSIVSYLYLKHNKWIIKSGIKFGANFLIYKESIRLYHASFAVIIMDNIPVAIKSIQVIQRVAESADKDVMILQVQKPIDLDICNLKEVYSRLTDFKINDIILKRFDFVNNK